MKTQCDRSDPRNSPTAWFCELDRAIKADDRQSAAAADKELRRLGVEVRFRRELSHQNGVEGASHA